MKGFLRFTIFYICFFYYSHSEKSSKIITDIPENLKFKDLKVGKEQESNKESKKSRINFDSIIGLDLILGGSLSCNYSEKYINKEIKNGKLKTYFSGLLSINTPIMVDRYFFAIHLGYSNEVVSLQFNSPSSINLEYSLDYFCIVPALNLFLDEFFAIDTTIFISIGFFFKFLAAHKCCFNSIHDFDCKFNDIGGTDFILKVGVKHDIGIHSSVFLSFFIQPQLTNSIKNLKLNDKDIDLKSRSVKFGICLGLWV